jgi:5-methylcytosine-specific restriction protein B
MTRKERQLAFEAHLKNAGLIQPGWRVAKGFGASNSLTVAEPGLELIDADLTSVTSADGYVFISSIGVPPGNELYVAVYVKSDAAVFSERLKAMPEAAKDASLLKLNSPNNNNVVILVARDGRMYLRNKGHWVDSLPNVDLKPFSPGINVDRVDIAIYPPTASAFKSLLMQEFVGYLAGLFGKKKLHEVLPWPADFKVNEAMRRSPAEIDMAEISSSIGKLGGFYDDVLLRRFHVALNHAEHKHFCILKGLSGTGKTSLAVQYSKAVHGIAEVAVEDPFLFVCAVRSDWTDPTGLTGYYDVISDRYIVPQFLEAVLAAIAHPDVPVFVCIDELNLAPVEYYFSAVLSSMETKLGMHLHSNSVALEGDNGEPIPRELPWPSNLYLVGTINTDETTHAISDKVLDRAVVIEMPSVNTSGFLDMLSKDSPEMKESASACCEILVRVNGILSPQHLGFGYRVIKEFVAYHHFGIKSGCSASQDSIDFQITDKILVKLRGAERQRQMLVELRSALAAYPNALAGVNALISQLDEFHAFQWSR